MTARADAVIVSGMWTRRTFPVIFFAVLAVAVIAHSAALVVIWLILAAGYAVSVILHPRARCLHCSGTGELRGSFFPWTFRRCPRCAGGRIIRRGATAIGLPHVREQARTQRQRQQNTKTRERW